MEIEFSISQQPEWAKEQEDNGGVGVGGLNHVKGPTPRPQCLPSMPGWHQSPATTAQRTRPAVATLTYWPNSKNSTIADSTLLTVRWLVSASSAPKARASSATLVVREGGEKGGGACDQKNDTID